MDPNGKIVYLFDQGLNFIHNADRLPDGNTLFTDAGAVMEVTPDGKEVWRFRLSYEDYVKWKEASRSAK